MQILSLYCFKNHRSEGATPEYPPVSFDVFGKFSESVLDGQHILQGILNFKLYILKAVDDWQIGISKWR